LALSSPDDAILPDYESSRFECFDSTAVVTAWREMETENDAFLLAKFVARFAGLIKDPIDRVTFQDGVKNVGIELYEEKIPNKPDGHSQFLASLVSGQLHMKELRSARGN